MLYEENKKYNTKDNTKATIRLEVLICIVLVCFAFCIPKAFANEDELEAEPKTYNGLEYIINNNEVTIISVKELNNSQNIEIPETIEGLPVTSISAIKNDRLYSANKIIIPESVVKIEEYVIEELSHKEFLEFVVSKNNPKYSTDSYGVLFNKDKTEIIKFPRKNLNKTYTIPNTVKTVGKTAFTFCRNLTSIKIPASVTNIEGHAFEYCTSLTSITIPNGITKIKDSTFRECESLKSVTLPSSVTDIDNSAFQCCSSLESITIPNGVRSIGYLAFEKCFKLEKVVIPASVTIIRDYAFEQCTGLKELILKERENNNQNEGTNIGKQSFRYCISLTSLIIPSNVNSIGVFAFENCNNLTTVVIEDGVKTIEDGAFYNCESLKNVTIPKSVTSIGDYSFTIKAEYIDDDSLEFKYKITKIERICGYKYSYAESYAQRNEIEFIIIGEDDSNKIIEGDFWCEDNYFSKEKYGFRYSDSYFRQKEPAYNQHLATMSLCLAYSAYKADTDDKILKNQDRNVKNVLEQCGFYEGYKQYHYDEKTEIDNVACVISHKTIKDQNGKDAKLIAIAVRGGGYGDEWGSNFTVGITGNHEGFSDAANIIYNRLNEYISEYNIKGNIKIWITGFSRAGAASNLFAAELDDLLEYGSANLGNAKYTKADIYAYCFATPAGADNAYKPGSEKYNNIYNVIHYHDPVPLVAPDVWNFDRYGITYIFPFQESNMSATKYEKKMIKRLEEMGEIYQIANFTTNINSGAATGSAGSTYLQSRSKSMGRFLRDFISIIAQNSKIDWAAYLLSLTEKGINGVTLPHIVEYNRSLSSRKKYVGSGLQNTMRIAMTVFRNNTGTTKKALLSAIENLKANADEFALLAIEHKDLLEIGALNLDKLVIAHATPEYYLAWMQSMDDYYVDGAEVLFSDGQGRIVKINCPVDVYVYDSNDNLVASIVEEVPQEDTPVLTAINENGEKLVYLPKDEEFKIKVVAREDCVTSITVNEYKGVSSITSKILCFEELDMNQGEEAMVTTTKYDENADSNSDESGAVYEVQISETIMEPKVIISSDEIENYTYSVLAAYDEEQGTVNGSGVFNIGDFCQLTATSKQGYLFEGWYTNEDEQVSGNNTYRFSVNENVVLLAKFNKCNHNSEKILVNINPATLTEDGTITYKCSECEEEITETIYHPETVQLYDDSYIYDGTEKTPIITVIDSAGNNVSESNYTIEYPESRVNAGEYTLKIIYKGNYSGTDTQTFTIKRKEIVQNEAVFTQNNDKENFTTEYIKVNIKVKDAEEPEDNKGGKNADERKEDATTEENKNDGEIDTGKDDNSRDNEKTINADTDSEDSKNQNTAKPNTANEESKNIINSEKAKSPQTGDKIAFVFCIIIVSAIVFTGITMYIRKE